MNTSLKVHKNASFHISIGEEGAVIVLCDGNLVKSKLFVRTVEEQDSSKLTALLTSNPEVPIYIYIDTLDQSYVQKNIPSASAMGIGKVAKSKLDRDTPKNHFKTCVQVGRMDSGRRDFLFTFISAPNEPPISNWISYLTPFDNIIQGIYFLPVELISLIHAIKSRNSSKEVNPNAHKVTLKDKIKVNSSPKPASKKYSQWELLITHNKTGGFRQVAYQNDIIVFSRMLNNIEHADPEVLAGNIEQEITNSVEYLSRLSLYNESSVDMYIILADEILKNIRFDKLKSNKIFTYTPFALARLLNIQDAASEKDKFADPTFLSVIAKQKKMQITLHTSITQMVYQWTSVVNYAALFFKILIPLILIMSMYNIFDLRGVKDNLNKLSDQIYKLKTDVNNSSKLIEKYESEIGDSLKMDHLVEIYNLYKFLNFQNANLIKEGFVNLSNSPFQDDVVAKTINIQYIDQVYDNYKGVNKSLNYNTANTITPWNYSFALNYNFIFLNQTEEVSEMQSQYDVLVKNIKTAFPQYKVTVSDLPDTFSAKNKNDRMKISADLTRVVEYTKEHSLQTIAPNSPTPTEATPQLNGGANAS